MRKRLRPFWLAIAVLFLFEAWVWDGCVWLGRRLISLLYLDRFKAAVARLIEPLPPAAALLVFIIPLAIIEPFKILALWLIASGHWILGLLGFVAAKFVGFGIIAFLFDLTRDKLLSMKWMAALYDIVMSWRDRAHAFVEPYKEALKQHFEFLFQGIRKWASLNSESPGIIGKLLRMRRRFRREAPRA